LELRDLSGPLQQFQALKVDEHGMLEALKAINSASDSKTDDNTIERLVPALWSQLQEKLDAIPEKAEAERHMRSQSEIMEDLVSQVRGLNGRMREFDPEVMERELRFKGSRSHRLHPKLIDELLMTMRHKEMPGGGEYSLLMLAGILRDTMPWISEVLVEAHRELKSASPQQARKAFHDLRRTIKFMTRSHFAEMMMGNSKQSHMLAMELPHIVERMLVDRFEGTLDSDQDEETNHELGEH
jgi:hypothetical protein